MNKESKSVYGGLSITWILTIVFLVLKLTGNTTWSWWWVFSPLWISTGVTILIVLAIFVIAKWIDSAPKWGRNQYYVRLKIRRPHASVNWSEHVRGSSEKSARRKIKRTHPDAEIISIEVISDGQH